MNIKKITILLTLVIFSIFISCFIGINNANLFSGVSISSSGATDLIDFNFEVSWSDDDFVKYRPESATYKLYNVLNSNDVVSTVTLTSANRYGAYLWKGTFQNVPKYNSNGTLANYYIVQDNLDNYTQKYSMLNIKSLCIEFGNNTTFTNSNNNYLSFEFIDENNKYKFLGKNSSNEKFYSYDLSNRTICVPMLQNQKKINMYGYALLDIKRIYPSGDNTYYTTNRSWFTGISNHYFGEHFPRLSPSSYTWEPTNSNFPNADLIINTVKYKNYNFNIEWDDDGFENERPSEVIVNLYNENDLDNIYKSISLNESNISGENQWSGTFRDIPKYNEDGTEARYIIKPVKNDNYVNYYDYSYPNVFCAKFGENVFNKDTSKKIEIADSIARVINNNDGSFEFDYSRLNNQTYCVPILDNLRKLVMKGDIYNLDIKYIYPTYSQILTEYAPNHYSNIEDVEKDYYNDDYPQNSEKRIISYTWEESRQSFPNADKIKFSYNKYNLTFDKYWEDANNSSLRPNQSIFYLYRKGDEANVLNTITLNVDNADSNDSAHWIGVFKNLSRYDENGNRIEYVVREKAIPNYVTSYDSRDGLSIKFGNNNKFGYPYAAHIYFSVNNELRELALNGNNIGDNLAGKTINIRTSNNPNLRYSSYNYVYDNNSVRASMTGKIEELYGENYPWMYRPTSLADDYIFHYNYSISNHSQNFYFVYRGDSWSNDYGIDIEKISTLGDETIITSRLNLRTLDITKKWDDEGYEDIRPSEAIIDIYNDKDRNNIIKTVKITNNDKVDEYIWKKTVENLPIFDESFNVIEYVIQERKSNDNYLVIYDADEEYNGLAIKFDENIFGFESANTGYYQDGVLKYNGNGRNHDLYPRKAILSHSYPDNISGRIVMIPSKALYLYLHNYNDNSIDGKSRIKINDIYPVKYTPYSSYTIGKILFPLHNFGISTYDDYLNISEDEKVPRDYSIWTYEWNGSLTPKKNCYIIINKFRAEKINFAYKKVWDDEGHEYLRPSEVKFDLYNVNDDSKVVSSITYRNDDKNEWNIIFNDIPKYNPDGSEAKYYLKENSINNYKFKYDLSKGNGFCIDFGVVESNDMYIKILVQKDNRYMYVVDNFFDGNVTSESSDALKLNLVSNKSICFNTESNLFYLYGDFGNSIKNIYPVYRDKWEYKLSNKYREYTLDGEPKISSLNIIDYLSKENVKEKFIGVNWDSYAIPFPNADTIINYNTIINYKFSKVWSDDEFESERPNEVNFNLYNVLDDSKVIATTTLKKDNQNGNTWYGEFKNVPKYNEDGSIARYYVKEELSKYHIKYGINNKTGYCVKTTDYLLNHNSAYIMLTIKKGEDYYYVSKKDNLNYLKIFSKIDLIDGEFCFETDSDDLYIYYYNTNGHYETIDNNQFWTLDKNPLIEYIYPVNLDKYDYVVGNAKDTYTHDYIDISDNDTFASLNEKNSYYVHYTWTPDDKVFPNSNIIINYPNMRDVEFVKVFDDEGFETFRPKEFIFVLYKESKVSPYDIVTIKTSDCVDNRCPIKFKSVEDKDTFGNTISYYVREVDTLGYDVSYENDKVINKAKPQKVYFSKVDQDGNNLSGALFGVYNKDGELVYQFTTTGELIETMLLPGEYVIKEINVPVGYKRAKESKVIVYKDGKIKQDDNEVEIVTISNDPVKIKMNLVNRLKSVVPGVKIQLLNSENEVVREWINEEEDLVLSIEVDVDEKYILRQIGEANGYLHSEDVSFEFNENNEVVINEKVVEENRVLLVVDKEFLDLVVEKKIQGNILEDEEFEFEIEIDNISNIESSKGIIEVKNGIGKFKLKGNESITLRLPLNIKYKITEKTYYKQNIDGDSEGELTKNTKVIFTNTNPTEMDSKEVNTGDNIYKYIKIFIISVISLIFILVCTLKRKYKNG